MQKINPNLYPHGGYTFTDVDGSRHSADSWAGVLARVIIYRKRAGLMPGNPQEELIAQVCQRHPAICVEVDPRTQAQRRIVSLKGKVLAWFSEVLRKVNSPNPPEYVNDETARARAAICAKCPKNTPLQEGCSSCKAAVKEMRGKIVDRRFGDGRLNSCLILGEDLQTSIHLEAPVVDSAELPGDCWRKKSL